MTRWDLRDFRSRRIRERDRAGDRRSGVLLFRAGGAAGGAEVFRTRRFGSDLKWIGRILWRRERDSNPRYGFPYTHFPGVRLRPLGHLSSALLMAKMIRICKGLSG